MVLQNRVTSEQSCGIIKTFSKLPKDFEMIIFPTLITIITDNEVARSVVGRVFDVNVSLVILLQNLCNYSYKSKNTLFLRCTSVFWTRGYTVLIKINSAPYRCLKNTNNQRWPKNTNSSPSSMPEALQPPPLQRHRHQPKHRVQVWPPKMP